MTDPNQTPYNDGFIDGMTYAVHRSLVAAIATAVIAGIALLFCSVDPATLAAISAISVSVATGLFAQVKSMYIPDRSIHSHANAQ